MRSLRRLSAFSFVSTALLLAMLIITGYSQNGMMNSYSAIVKESESTIFFYSTIREQTTKGLLSKDVTQLLGAATAIEQLHGRYTAMLDNHLIPSEYKLSFLQKIDLEQIAIHLKNMAETPQDDALALAILDQLRQINNQFLQFDRIVVSEMRSRVMHYQKQALVLMGFIILLTNSTLIILYKKSVRPLVVLARQSQRALVDHVPLFLTDEKKSSVEVKTIISSFNQLLGNSQEEGLPPPSHREAEFSAVINDVTNRLNGIINYSQLLADYCATANIAEEHKKMLYKIIDNGEKSAQILQKSLHGSER